MFTPKFGRRTRELASFQNYANQGIDCMRISISRFRYDPRIGSLVMTPVDSDDELQLALGNYISDSAKKAKIRVQVILN